MPPEDNRARIPLRERRLVVFLAAGLALFYFIFRSRNHPVDAVLYALAADVKDAYPFFHWHHLLYTPVTWLALHGARALGYAGDAFGPLAAFSAAAAATAAALFYLALRRLGGSVAGAALATAFLAFSAAWWYFAGEAEVLAVISLFIAGALCALAGREPTLKGALLLACWLGVGTVFHQAVSLFVPVGLIVLAWRKRERWLRVAAFGSTYAAVALLPYFLIPRFYYGVRGWNGWLLWVTYYLRWGDWGYVTGERMGRGVVTMLGAVVAGPNAFDVGKAFTPTHLMAEYMPAVLVLAAALGTVAAYAGVLWRTRRRWLVAAAIWFLSFHFFFAWWEPENVEWWIATVMPLWLLFGLAVPRKRAFQAGAAIAITLVAVVNFNRVIYPATFEGRNDAEAAARTIVSVTRPGDAIFMAHVDANFWIDYLSRHTRTLPSPQPFCKPAADAPAKLEYAARRGFPEYTGRGNALYFTDFEWDDPFLSGYAREDELKVVFFKMIRRAQPITTLRFPGGSRVLYRFTAYGDDIRDARIYEAEGRDVTTDRAVLSYTGASISIKFEVPQKGRYVLAVEANGSEARGVWSAMEVAVDGRWFGRTAVDAPFGRFYEMKCDLAAGTHDLRITFTNDYFDPATGKGRDLFVNRLIVYRDVVPGGSSGTERPGQNRRSGS